MTNVRLTDALHMVLDEDGMRRVVVEAVLAAGSQSAFARRAGVARTTLSKVLNGSRPVGRHLAEHLGFTRTRCYTRGR